LDNQRGHLLANLIGLRPDGGIGFAHGVNVPAQTEDDEESYGTNQAGGRKKLAVGVQRVGG
jgi:hypothetical protein